MPSVPESAAPADPIAAVCHPDPYAHYAALRAAGPVHWLPNRQAWALVSAQAVSAALQLPAARVRPPAEPVPAFLAGTPAAGVYARLARMTDGAEHARRRAHTLALVQRLDAARLSAGAGAAFEAWAGPWHARRDGPSLDALVSALPVMSVLAALALPAGLHAGLWQATDDWVNGLSPLASSDRQQRAVVAMDDLLGLLARSGVTDADAAAAHVAVLMQPHDATAGLIGAGLLRLRADAVLRQAAESGRLDWARFAEEVLRHDPPIQNTRRTLAEDATVCGHALRAGDALLLVLASASRDLPPHQDPEAFRMDRETRSPWTLGAGPHQCPGGAAAVAIACAVWPRLWPGLAEARLGPPAWRRSVNARIPSFSAPP